MLKLIYNIIIAAKESFMVSPKLEMENISYSI